MKSNRLSEMLILNSIHNNLECSSYINKYKLKQKTYNSDDVK